MKILFMGTPEFSVPTLSALIESDHEVIGVVTQPDKPKGRGKQMVATPVKAKALEYNIPVYQPRRVRDPEFLEIMKDLAMDVAVVIAFGQILPKAFLELPPLGCVNIHASLLPKYRGSAPIQWTVIDGETMTGITTMQMDTGVDTGDMLLKEEVVIEADETGGSLHDKLMVLGGPLVLKTLDGLVDGSIQPIKQDDASANYIPMLSKELGNIKWSDEAVVIERLIRGLNPWPSAYTGLNGKLLKVWEATVIEHHQASEPGTVIQVDKQGILVACGQGALMLTSVQLQGKKRMAAADFVRGYKVEVGTILSLT